MEMNLNKWLTSFGGFGSQKMEDVGLWVLLVFMLVSLLSSLFLSFLYSRFYKSRATGSQIHRAFPLLGISVTAIFICIQFSLPLSLGLLGALSIVRFRTPIKEAEEIGFIMLVVAASICIATFNLVFLGIILVIAVLALFTLNWRGGLVKGRLNDGMFIITLPTDAYLNQNREISQLMESKLPKSRLDSVTESDTESTISYSFVNIENGVLPEIQEQLKALEKSAKSNVFFNRSGEV